MEFVNANQTSEQRRAKYLFLKMAGVGTVRCRKMRDYSIPRIIRELVERFN